MGEFESKGRSHIFEEDMPALYLISVISWSVGMWGSNPR